MPKRFAAFLALICLTTIMAALLPAAASAASPWWQLITGARPTILNPGGSGRLTLSLINLGDAPVDATRVPLVIEDELPEGTTATEVFALTGYGTQEKKLACALDSPTHVTCRFEGTLPPYEALEAEVFVNVNGSPPAVGQPGEVTVSGSNAPAVSASQPIKVGPEPTPFGIEHYYAKLEQEGGTDATQAGAHPFQFTSTLQLNSGPAIGTGEGLRLDQPAQLRNQRVPLPAGLVGNAAAVQRCTLTDFFAQRAQVANQCPDASTVGVINVAFHDAGLIGYRRFALPVFNLTPEQGEPVRFGFTVIGDPVLVDTSVDPNDHYRVIAAFHNTTQLVQLVSGTFIIWGAPGDPRHDSSRGWGCAVKVAEIGPCERPPSLGEKPFLRLPVSCSGPLDFSLQAEPWNVPLESFFDTASAEAPGMTGCNKVPFDPTVGVEPSSKLVANPTGLDFNLDMPNAGLENPSEEAVSEGQAKKVEVTLPEGVTVNPSEAEGLAVCTEADYAREKYDSRPGEGCPEASKIGSVEIETPLLEEKVRGALYIAAPHENPFDSLVAIYLVARAPDRGVLIKLAGELRLDPQTGQITTTFDELPQLPFSKFTMHFREGARAPLVTPSACGAYRTLARFVPWSAADPSNPSPSEVVQRTSTFAIEHGADGGACPGSTPPFDPVVVAGTNNNAAGSYSPFYMRLSRKDGEQEITKFSTVMPPGLTGNLTGIPFCPDSAIEAARHRTGREELDSPSCPAASEIGHSIVGAGVGQVLAQTPGKIYLAGPYHGSALSVASITSATVGPFDLGTVVIRFALRINPVSGQVEIDSTGSDPIPHIIDGIVVHVRDIRVYIDREKFMINPTNCDPLQVSNTIAGAGANIASTADDSSVTVATRFQDAECRALAFKPRFGASTSGKTSRTNGASLAVRLTYPKTPLGTQSNIRSVRVELPKQLPSRLSTLQKACPDTTFDQNPAACPAESRVGYAKAITPILPVPLEGPAYFVSHGGSKWPELIVVLQGYGVTIDLHGETFIDKGITSSTFRTVPDQPVSSFQLTLPQGPDSALAVPGSLCNITKTVLVKHKTRAGKLRKIRKTVAGSLIMPTTFTAQNGLVIHQDTKIAVTGCARHKTRKAQRPKGHH
jgi:hypothetical protein